MAEQTSMLLKALLMTLTVVGAAPAPDSQYCPEGCSCYYRPANRSSLIDCQGRGLSSLPQVLPVHPEAVYHELTLDDNQLEDFVIGSRQGYANLTHLRLANNRLQSFDPDGLPSDLHLIDLSHNRLERLSEKALCLLTSGTELESIYLSGNPFFCDCPNFKIALVLRGGFKQVKDADKVLCPDGKQLNRVEERDVCKGGFPQQGQPCYEDIEGSHIHYGSGQPHRHGHQQ